LGSDHVFGISKSVQMPFNSLGSCSNLASTRHFDNTRLVLLKRGDDGLHQHYNQGEQMGEKGRPWVLVRRKHTNQGYIATKSKQHDEQGITREVQKLQSLRHPNCIKLVEFSPSSQTMIYESVIGDTLLKRMQKAQEKGRMAETMVRKVFEQAMRGVAFLHANECVHNDLKPSNLMFIQPFKAGCEFRVVLTDFSLLRSLKEMTEIPCGDLRYLSPERWNIVLGGDPVPAEPPWQKNDIWAMGVVLYNLLGNDFSLPYLGQAVELEDFTEHKACLGGLANSGGFRPDTNCAACTLVTNMKEALAGTEPLQIPGVVRVKQQATKMLNLLLCREPASRPSAKDALDHQWLATEAPLSLGNLEFAVHPNVACQVLLNFIMWHLTHHEDVKKCYRAFCLFDKDRTGRVSRQRFKNAFGKERNAYSADGAVQTAEERVFDLGDVDGNEFLDFNEFATLCFTWTSIDNELLDKHIHEAFADIGSDEGDVDVQQLKEFLGHEISQHEFDSYVADGSRTHLSHKAMRDFIVDSRGERLVITWDGSCF